LKTNLKSIFDFSPTPRDNPVLLRAQYVAFSQQMPMMYFILLSSTWALALTYLHTAPRLLSLGVPCLFTVMCGARILFWLRSRGDTPPIAAVASSMRRINILGAVIAASFTTWSCLLYPYGDAFQKSHVAFYMAITVISCIFCMMHVRSAALMVTAIVNGTFVVFFASTGHLTLIATAINILLVCFGMLVVLKINYDNFEQMVLAQQKTEALSNENLKLANIDSLTELPNRRAFFHHLDTSFTLAQAENHRLAVGVIDLDGFKPVNDLYGHSAGDRLLKEVGERLQDVCNAESMFLSRLGGDEFAFIISGQVNENTVLAAGNLMGSKLRIPFETPDATIMISASIGIAIYPDVASTPEELFDRADYALYQSKREHRGNSTLFTTKHIVEIHRDARVEQTLRQADLANELSVVYQPILDVNSGKTVGFEALARWNSKLLGTVPPAQFIPIAERAGIINMLTKPLLKKALATAKTWPQDIRLSFNLSAQDINSAEATLGIIAIIANSGLDPQRLDLEITETAIIHDTRQARKSVEMLRKIGCGISLDDFGTGYSSLTSLHSLPLTKLKIDRSFVRDIQDSDASYNIVRSLLTLSREMGLDTIVEGVETQAELAVIKALGGTLVQGYVFSRPIQTDDVHAFLNGCVEESFQQWA